MFVIAFNSLPLYIRIINGKMSHLVYIHHHIFSVTIVHARWAHGKVHLAIDIVYTWAHTMGLPLLSNQLLILSAGAFLKNHQQCSPSHCSFGRGEVTWWQVDYIGILSIKFGKTFFFAKIEMHSSYGIAFLICHSSLITTNPRPTKCFICNYSITYNINSN